MRFSLKTFLLVSSVFMPMLVLAFAVPEKPTGFVSDFAGILSTENHDLLETKISNFEKNTTNEIAVVTIPGLDGDTIENVAQEIFTKWGIGKKDKNNGVLFLIAMADRKTRIHTGYGVEGDLTDIGTSYIQREIVTPAFQEGKYYEGINGAVDKMIEALGGENIVPGDYGKESSGTNFEFLFWIFIIFFQVVLSLLSSTKSWWGGGVVGGILGAILWYLFISTVFIGLPALVILILLGLFLDYVVSKSYTNARAMGTYPWWMRGGGGGSGGGGFGGFGGGSSGGGGSSSSW